MKVKNYEAELNIPQGTTVTINKPAVKIKGPKGEVERTFREPVLNIQVKESRIIISAKDASRKEKKLVETVAAHIKNILKGVSEGHEYKLKICSGHFPMNVSVAGEKFIIKNFLGEAVPRTLTLKKGADVKVQGEIITVTSANKELAAQVAADIEQLSKVKNRDNRVFQDGIYIISKDGKEM